LAKPHFQKPLDDLPCAQLAEHHSKKQLDDLPCTQLSEHHSKELTDDLPCTQLAKHRFKDQLDSLPSTQLAEHSFKELTDDLPCTQLAENCSKEQPDNLPCTQLAKPHFQKPLDDLPCTQLAEPHFQKPLDDLPCTQFAEHHSKKQLNNLLCTQLAKHHPKELTDDLPCTQLAEHCSKEQLDSLPCTQLAKPHFQKSLDDLPCTQLAEHHSKKQLDDLPCTQLAEHCSEELTDDLPCTQLAEHCSKEGAGNLLHTQLAEHCSREQLDNLPHTQLSKQCPEGKLENLPYKLLSDDKVVPVQNNRGNHNKIPYNFESDLLESRSQTLDDSHSKLLKFLKEKSNDENFSEEREQISALLLHSGNLEVKKSIKKMGGHKNLPQVLMHASLKHIPVPKPTNKKTFSFDQVKQYYGLKEDKETSNNNIVNKVNGFISPTCKSSIESSCILFPGKHLVKYDAGVDENILKSEEKDNEEEIEIIPMNPENVKKEKEILEVVVSSDDEDFPQIQSHDNFSNKILDCNLKEQNQKSCVSFSCIPIKQEKLMDNHLTYVSEKKICNKVENSVALNGNINCIVKKETDGINFKEHSKTINNLNSSAFIKKEKEVCCEERKENVLEQNKIKSSLQLKSEKSIGRKIKHENKMDDAVESKDKSVQKEKHDSERKSSRNQDLTVSNDCNFLKEKQTRNDVEQNNFNVRRDKRKSEVDHYTNGKIQVKDTSLSMSELKKQDIAKEKNVSKRTYENKEKCISKNRTITESRKDKTIKNKEKYLGRDNEMVQSIEKHLGKNNKNISSKEKNDSRNKITSQSNSENKLVGNGKLVTEKRKLSSMDVEKSNKRYKRKWSEDSNKVKNNEKEHIIKEKSDKDRKKSLSSRNDVITMKNNNEFEKKLKNIHEENMINKKDSAKLSLGKKCPSKSVIPHSNEKKRAEESDQRLTSESIKNFKDVKNEKLLNSNIYSTSFNALRTNLKKEPSNTSNVLMLEREKTTMGNMKDRRKSTFSKSPSYSEDTCDSYNSPSMKSKVLTKKYPEKFKHQKNALTVLNQVADEIIAFSDKSKSHMFLDEPIDLDIIKKGCDSFKGRKVDRKHIKDEIAEEVKIALKPFYTSGLIDKDEYKDIMRKVVPKVYLNCGHYVNPEKIKNLVTNYIKRLNNS
ncbi:PHD and RING finger domain-containing protein 1, partial [Trichonephila inaurata madagascariensis]